MSSISAQNPNQIKPFCQHLPKHWLRNGTLQTLLSHIQSPNDRLVNQGEQTILIDGGTDETGMDPDGAARLVGYYTAHKSAEPCRGLVMTIHGWEGCSHSSYNLVVGSALVAAGYDVLRLNLRDHGPSHGLNRGLFYVTLLNEVLAATRQVAALAGDLPFYLLGASLGGNFALRLALAHAAQPIDGLAGILAVNPAINPSRSTDLVDHHTWIRLYFRRRWLASLHTKQELFPALYNFAPVEKIPSIRDMTEWMIQHYSTYPDVESYFADYAVSPAKLNDLTVPVTIVTAADDPIIPADDFYNLPPHPLLTVHVLPTGGHVGYTDLFPLRHFLAPMALEILGSFS